MPSQKVFGEIDMIGMQLMLEVTNQNIIEQRINTVLKSTPRGAIFQ